jgi:hypothetical protein
MEALKKIMIDRTNQVFEQTIRLKNYTQEIVLLNTYFYWTKFVDKKFPSEGEVRELLDEATLDLITSLFNTFSGFYRQGMVSLRSSLELTALYVYYFDHPIEFKYFLTERGYRGPMLSELINKGDFLVKKYCSLFINEDKLKKELHTEVENTYKELSKYVHGRLGRLQTLTSFPINFNKKELSNFMKEWEKLIGIGNTILAVRFSNEMNEMDKEEKDAVCSTIKKLDILEV